MNRLNIDSEMSLTQLENGVEFVTTGHAIVECTVSDYSTSFAIDPDYEWKRKDIKELIEFLKAVRKLIPKESE